MTAEMLLKPARPGDFYVMVMSPVLLTAEQTESMMRCVHSCLVHNTLLSLPAIKIEIAAGVLQ